MKTKTNNNPARNLVKRAMDFTVQTASLTRTASLRGILFMGADMRNQGQAVCAELLDVEAQAQEWENKQIRVDAERFRHIIRENRMRLGLEASNA